MSDLVHAEFEMDGYRWGPGHPVYLGGIETPGLVWRDQDLLDPVAERVLFGRDLRDIPPWKLSFTITGKGDTEEEAAADAATRYEELAHAWACLDQRGPGAEVPLVFAMHTTVRCLYGRPRGLTPENSSDLFVLSTVKAEATFQPSSPDLLDGVQRSTPAITLTPGSAGGFVFPIVFPWGTLRGGQRQGIIPDGGGRTPTHDVQIEFHGPINRPRLTGPGFDVGLTTNLAHDRSVTIDARTSTVLWDNGSSAAGVLTPHARLGDITIPPGQSELAFTGEDQSGTGTCIVRWRPTIVTL